MNRKNFEIPGLHHVTAVARQAQRTVDFYTQVLGLRLVKKTVNFDDPRAYHLYFGDRIGHPGTILTFFIWTAIPAGRRGAGQAAVVSFRVPGSSLGYWKRHLDEHGVSYEKPASRFDEEVLSFLDPDGLALELVAVPGLAAREPADGESFREQQPVASEHALQGFHSVCLWEQGYEQTASLLQRTLGFQAAGEQGGRLRFLSSRSETQNPGAFLDLLRVSERVRGVVGPGTVHHIAWRTPGEAPQQEWRRRLVEAGLSVTPIIDRVYFRSIYFREPAGVLFEIATDPPGFTADESLEDLGSSLKLPLWLEPERSQLEALLPPLQTAPLRAEKRGS